MPTPLTYKRSLLIILLIAVSSCRSTSHLSPGNPLPGIALEASKNTLLFSWANDIPLAQQLRANTTVEVLAEYNTAYGKVTNEVLAKSRVRAGINGIKLDLVEATKFEPTSPICLRLAVNRFPIPLRIATFAQSSNGFYYSAWAESASLNSAKVALQQRQQRLNINIRNFSQADPNFAHWQQQNQIYDPKQCEDITIQENSAKPLTAIQGEQKEIASAEHCVALYKDYRWKIRDTDEKVVSKYLPSIDEIIIASQQRPSQLAQAKQMEKDFKNHAKGKVYFPRSNIPIDQSLQTSLTYARDGLSESSAGLVIEAYQACKLEANVRFDESYNDWQMVSNPANIEARIEPLRRICRARFNRDQERRDRLQEFIQANTELESEIASLNQQKHRKLPNKTLLIPNACPAENS